MNTEKIGIALHTSVDAHASLEPHWYSEATDLIEIIVGNKQLELQRIYEPDSPFGKRLASFLAFEARVKQKGKVLIDGLPSLSRYELTCQGEAVFLRLLGRVSFFMYYESLGLMESSADLKRRFFLSLLTDVNDLNAPPHVEDFAIFYQAIVKELGQGNDLLIMLDFHMHFDARFNEYRDAITQLADMIREEAKPIRYLWQDMTADLLAKQANALMAEHVLIEHYAVRHVFPMLIAPSAVAVIDNRTNCPLLFVGVLAHEIWSLPEQKQPLEWKTNLLKLLGDPVRYQILLKSKARPVYLSELAREFELKPSTVSHHLNALHKEMLLFSDLSDKESRKQFYTLNRDTIARLIAELNELL